MCHIQLQNQMENYQKVKGSLDFVTRYEEFKA